MMIIEIAAVQMKVVVAVQMKATVKIKDAMVFDAHPCFALLSTHLGARARSQILLLNKINSITLDSFLNQGILLLAMSPIFIESLFIPFFFTSFFVEISQQVSCVGEEFSFESSYLHLILESLVTLFD